MGLGGLFSTKLHIMLLAFFICFGNFAKIPKLCSWSRSDVESKEVISEKLTVDAEFAKRGFVAKQVRANTFKL